MFQPARIVILTSLPPPRLFSVSYQKVLTDIVTFAALEQATADAAAAAAAAYRAEALRQEAMAIGAIEQRASLSKDVRCALRDADCRLAGLDAALHAIVPSAMELIKRVTAAAALVREALPPNLRFATAALGDSYVASVAVSAVDVFSGVSADTLGALETVVHTKLPVDSRVRSRSRRTSGTAAAAGAPSATAITPPPGASAAVITPSVRDSAASRAIDFDFIWPTTGTTCLAHYLRGAGATAAAAFARLEADALARSPVASALASAAKAADLASTKDPIVMQCTPESDSVQEFSGVPGFVTFPVFAAVIDALLAEAVLLRSAGVLPN